MMDHIPDRSPERELARLFREEREGWDREADRARLVEACVAACEAEAAALERRGAGASLPAFLAAQARFTPPGVWIAIASVGVLAVAGAGAGPDGPAAFQALSSAGGLLALFVVFVIMYMVGIDQWVCIGFGVVSASVLVWVTFRMNSKYGEWGLMKLHALRSHPRYIISRRKFLRLFSPTIKNRKA